MHKNSWEKTKYQKACSKQILYSNFRIIFQIRAFFHQFEKRQKCEKEEKKRNRKSLVRNSRAWEAVRSSSSSSQSFLELNKKFLFLTFFPPGKKLVNLLKKWKREKRPFRLIYALLEGTKQLAAFAEGGKSERLR